jgi:2-keto-4-pentenoate hydratase
MTDPAAAARALAEARRAPRQADVPADVAPRDLAEAYAAHLALLDLLVQQGDGPRVGWKVGFTNAPAQARHGASEPVFAGLLGRHAYAGEAEVAAPDGVGLGVEAELAVRLGAPLAGPVSREEAAAAVEAVAIAIEIVERRNAFDEIGLPLLVADGSHQFGSVIGPWRDDYDPLTMLDADVKLQVDGQTDGFMRATEVLGDPLHALAWLSAAAERHGAEVRAGDVVLLGAIIPAQPLERGQVAEVASDGLGDVRVWID